MRQAERRRKETLSIQLKSAHPKSCIKVMGYVLQSLPQQDRDQFLDNWNSYTLEDDYSQSTVSSTGDIELDDIDDCSLPPIEEEDGEESEASYSDSNFLSESDAFYSDSNAQSETESEAEEEFSLSKRTPLRVLTVPKQQLPQNDLFDTVSTSSDSEDESLVFSQPKRSIQRKNADSLPKRMTEQSKSGEDGVNTSDKKQGKPQLEEQDCPQQKQPPRDQTNDETQQPRRSRRLKKK
jgi:hypothetical protein